MPTAPPRELGDELVRIVKLMSAARAQAPALRVFSQWLLQRAEAARPPAVVVPKK